MVSRDVVFQETDFPYAIVLKDEDVGKVDLSLSPIVINKILEDNGPTLLLQTGPTVVNPVYVDPSTSRITIDTLPPPSSDYNEAEQHLTTASTSAIVPPVTVEVLRREKRKKTRSITLDQFVNNTVATHPSMCESDSQAIYPIENYLDCHQFSESHKVFIVAITINTEPKTYKEAVADDIWRDNMSFEIVDLQRNNTFSIEDLPPGKATIGNKWIYRIKYRSDGTIERYKTRLVALGNFHKDGVDYDETFAPVAKMSTIQIFLGVAAAKDWHVYQMDSQFFLAW